jgi:hypothetical protein
MNNLALGESRVPGPGGSTTYFTAARPAAANARRILLISYHFPPDPAVGGLRLQHMARAFGEAGWAVDVVARDFRDMRNLDRARLEDLPPGTRVFSVDDREPMIGTVQRTLWPMLRRFRGLGRTRNGLDALTQAEVREQRDGPRGVVRSYLAWLEFARGANWARAAEKAATALARTGDYIAVISSGPPHMAHEAARLVSRATGLPHVADLRDPWSLVQRIAEDVASPTWLRLAQRYEGAVVANAALVTVNTEPCCHAMRAAYPAAACKTKVVRNGCDDDPLPTPTRDSCFRIRFAGSIYMDRDPRLVFRAASRVIHEKGLRPGQLQFELIGDAHSFAGTSTMRIAKEEGIAEFVSVGGLIPRKEVFEFLAGATMLLSLPQDSDFAIPAKIYEYMRFDAWMLVLSPPRSATAQVLRDTDADVIEPADVDEITRVLRLRYEQFAKGIQPKAVAHDGRFDRKVQTAKLIGFIKEIDEARHSRRDDRVAALSP